MKTISLPAGPFFLDSQGRYLPTLTDLVIHAAAFEELFKLRLKRKCFAALAAECPKSVVQSDSDFPVAGSDKDPAHMSERHADLAVTQQPVSTFPEPSPFGVYPKGRW